MKISLTKKYKTDNGDTVRIYAVDGGGRRPIQGAVLWQDRWTLTDWHSDGRYRQSDPDGDDLDLVEIIQTKPKKAKKKAKK